MRIFAGLLLAHLLYDFHWQGPFIADNKGKHFLLLAVHAATWSLLLYAILWILEGQLLWWQWPMLFITHLLTDGWKARQPRTPENFWLIYVDQGIHLVTICLAAFVGQPLT